ncbi:MAG TPA: ferrochelatase [Flavobacteriaceae bacterium]|nr:ferrochelatase [Flavobacteriaceae bacterium]MCB9212046.1 ferrochelatase [Alteromonas sp.]HPF09859.1 ferrochelatase [Flavobacteriaceae bacterium]HQU19956.1 ferrochelatase [Flavobacteriaceae bacterium]HQU64058.1 ferrochelatase [Flavobacteriaceae bacterium]
MKKGVLLVNLGSPDSTNPKDVRKYLEEFLMDPRVIDLPKWARTLLVKGIILNTRPKKSAEAYQKIWWKEGSPLIVISKKLQEKVQEKTTVPVGLAMRYGSMSLEKGLETLHQQGVNQVLVIPLYPQFAMATTETIQVKLLEIQKNKFPTMELTFLPAFYNDEEYIDVLSQSIAASIQDKKVEHLLFSYHGVPERHIRKSDVTKGHCALDEVCCKTPSEAHRFCYRHQCLETTRLVAEKLQLPKGSYSTSFQSRLGFDPWLQPYTDRTIERFGKMGIKSMAIVTPAFVSDCLETLEEIAMEGKEIFLEMGGTEFITVPCLNDSDAFASLLSKWIEHWQIKDLKTAIA